ncbi:DUF29 domain-containing protein [soil metagenome]
MADDLYHDDYYAWTLSQAEALRARKAGENALDYDNLAEELEDLGRSEARACESYVEKILEHLLKIEFGGDPQNVPHWTVEVRAFRRGLRRNLSPSLKPRIVDQLPRLYADVREELIDRYELEGRAVALPETCPYGWSQIVADEAPALGSVNDLAPTSTSPGSAG